jgi:hypothetical protein
VHPVTAERRIVRLDGHGESVRQSPRRDKLVAPSVAAHPPDLTIEVLLLREDHIRAARPLTSRRRIRDPGERRLVEVLDRVELRSPSDVLQVLPALLPEPFSTRELAELLRCKVLLAQRTVYCLRMVKIVEPAGKRGRSPLHRRTPDAEPAHRSKKVW